MGTALARNWWMLVLRGVFAIIFGVLAFLFPGTAGEALVIFFGAYALVDGIFNIIAAFSSMSSNRDWWVMLLEGVVGVIAGILTFIWPGGAALVLLTFIAVWAIMTGIFEIITAFRLRHEIDNEVLMGLAGLASIIFGVLLVVFPVSGALAIVWMIAAYAIIFGVILIALGLRLRNYTPTGRSTTAPA